MERDYESRTVFELKDELRRLDASVTGNKPELIQRLRDAKKDYSEMTVVELKDELRRRGLVVKGLKQDLIERLEGDDKQQTYLDIIPKDIIRYEFRFTDPTDLRLRCQQKHYKLLCQNDKVLEEYLEGRGLKQYMRNVDEGLAWAAEMGSPDFVNYFVKKGATNFDAAMARAALKGH